MILRKKLACNYQGRSEIFWRPDANSNRFSLNFYRPRTGLTNFLRAVPKFRIIFRRKCWSMWKPAFTSTIFPNIPVTSWRLLCVGTPGSCLTGPALVTINLKLFILNIVSPQSNKTIKCHKFKMCFIYLPSSVSFKTKVRRVNYLLVVVLWMKSCYSERFFVISFNMWYGV